MPYHLTIIKFRTLKFRSSDESGCLVFRCLLYLPICIDDGSFLVADVFVVPEPKIKENMLQLCNHSGGLKSDHSKSGNMINLHFLKVRFQMGPVFKWTGYSYCSSPDHLKTGPFKIQTHQSRFQMVNTRWQPFWWVLKLLGSWISDPI